MKVEIIQIWAIGTTKRFMWIKFTEQTTLCFRISDELYQRLRNAGVPTSQSKRWKK